MSNESTEKPDWWIKNETVREDLGLPAYDPPRFKDDVYAHEVINELDEDYDTSIRILGVATEYQEDWEVRIDGESAFPIGKHRNEYGNTVYLMNSESFREKVKATVADD